MATIAEKEPKKTILEQDLSNTVNISLSEKVLLDLLKSGAIAGCNFKCTDSHSKNCVRKLFLQSCASCMCRAASSVGGTDWYSASRMIGTDHKYMEE